MLLFKGLLHRRGALRLAADQDSWRAQLAEIAANSGPQTAAWKLKGEIYLQRKKTENQCFGWTPCLLGFPRLCCPGLELLFRRQTGARKRCCLGLGICLPRPERLKFNKRKIRSKVSPTKTISTYSFPQNLTDLCLIEGVASGMKMVPFIFNFWQQKATLLIMGICFTLERGFRRKPLLCLGFFLLLKAELSCCRRWNKFFIGYPLNLKDLTHNWSSLFKNILASYLSENFKLFCKGVLFTIFLSSL